MELFLRCKNNFVLVLTLSLILCDLIHVSETQVPQSEMKTLVRVKLQGHFHFSDSVILLRTNLNDSIFCLELSPCLTKQFMHSRPLHSESWNLSRGERSKVPVLQPSWISTTDVSSRPHFPGAPLPSATVSLEMCHIGNERQEVECSTVWLYCREGRESHSVWLDYPDHVSILLDSNCQYV